MAGASPATGNADAASPEGVSYADIQPILATHCAGCHNVNPPPKGVALGSYDQVRAVAARIKAVSVDTQVMPMGNPTRMTVEERQRLGAWIAAGTPR